MCKRGVDLNALHGKALLTITSSDVYLVKRNEKLGEDSDNYSRERGEEELERGGPQYPHEEDRKWGSETKCFDLHI